MERDLQTTGNQNPAPGTRHPTPAIIRVENLGKQYHIGAARGAVRYETLRDALVKALRSPFRRRAARGDTRIWALRDVSFEVAPGEVLGVIGSNGSGKSTLLKILSRITRPTTGRVELYGHVASLLEVGTGFHPDLTGRENVYLNGAILGMRRREIDEKFAEIVAFAEIDRFLDTPVKHYSSGMYVRLAFAVAAHLDPDILIVDEVLSVGDLSFQHKCLGKMDDVTRSGRTVILVSHSMRTIEQLCDRVILLDRGRAQMIGPAAEVVAYYEERCRRAEAAERPAPAPALRPVTPPQRDGVRLSAAGQSLPAAAAELSLGVTAPEGHTWEAVSRAPFIAITAGRRGVGPGCVQFTVAVNPEATPRRGHLEVNGLRFIVLQGAAYADVPEGHEHFAAIGRLSARGLPAGLANGAFDPDRPVSRDEAAAFMIAALGFLDPPAPPQPRYRDVPADHPYYAYIEQMAARRITVGNGPQYFSPREGVNQAQLAAFVVRALGEPAPPRPAASRFADVPDDSPFLPFIERYTALGIEPGETSDHFHPDAPVTRGQLAAILVRAFKL